MKHDIKNRFNKEQPLIWQYLYSRKIRELESVQPSKFTEHLSNRLKQDIGLAKTFTNPNSRDLFHIQKDISFIFRVIPSLLDIAEFDLNYFTQTGFDLLKAKIPSRLKNDILYYLDRCSNKIIINKEIIDTYTLISLNIEESFQTRLGTISLLKNISQESFFTIAEKVIEEDGNHSIFLKKKLVPLLIELVHKDEKAISLLDKLIEKKKPFILQGIAEKLNLFYDEKTALHYFEKVASNSEASVACSAVKSILMLIQDRDSKTIYNKALEALSSRDEKVSSFAIKAVQSYLIKLKQKDLVLFSLRLKQTVPILEKIIKNSGSLVVCNLSKMALERLWVESGEATSDLYYRLKSILKIKKRSVGIRVSNEIIASYDEETLGRVLCVLSQESFSIQFVRTAFGGVKLVKDAFFKFRLWRFIYELLHPSPSKRQTFKNTIGRHFIGKMRSASCILSEEAESGIPGEPVFIKSNSSSSPFLPLVDDFLSAAESNNEYKLFSYEGVTIIKPSESFFKRFLSELKITYGFKDLSNLRNKANLSYIKTFRKMGFDICIKPYSKDGIFVHNTSKEVKRFFSFAFLMPSTILKVAEDLKSYFFSLYTNTLNELWLFILAFMALFISRHISINMLFRRARKSFLLCIGGWGTRGKSSVERLKTALFLSMGCSVFSKTSGSEASFTYTDSSCKALVIPIFRPYEKATISEQLKFVRIASKFKTEVFLWECMAIAPRYVKVMQNSWMKDDISTITNTYPDHEDAQGPAGWNIAETMTNFIPSNALLITTEKEMYPFLEDEAIKKGTTFDRVDEGETFTLTSDILSLFPYKEHPKNISLVLRLGEMLGIDSDIALKGMIDNIMPDIGALNEFPPVIVNNKKIVFISGMSANEKAACLYNWEVMKMNAFPKGEKVITATLINNRGDRPVRTKVFAEMLVKDLNADVHFLAGTNLNTFMMHLKKACSEKHCLTKSETDALLGKVVLIKDESISPEELFKIFAFHIPDGYSMRIMGIENIKGIGIRVCRWLECRESLIKETKKYSKFFSVISSFFDPIFMVRRKKLADAVYRKLSKNSISRSDAITRLNELNSK